MLLLSNELYECMSELSIYSTTCMNFKIIMPSKRSQAKKSIHIVLCVYNSRKCKLTCSDKTRPGVTWWGGDWQVRLITAGQTQGHSQGCWIRFLLWLWWLSRDNIHTLKLTKVVNYKYVNFILGKLHLNIALKIVIRPSNHKK